MRECRNSACRTDTWFTNEDKHCDGCGKETHASVTCPCGEEFNLRYEVWRLTHNEPVRFCSGCGQAKTENFLTSRMHDNLDAMLQTVKAAGRES